jgi:hypothetical protein
MFFSNKIKPLHVSPEHHKTPSAHARPHTLADEPTVKERDHHLDTEQDFNEVKIFINFEKSILTILSPNVTHI